MLTPQFSLRRLLLIVTVCAVLSLIPAVASRGYLWAIAGTVAIGSVVLFLMIQVFLFLVVRMSDLVLLRKRDSELRN